MTQQVSELQNATLSSTIDIDAALNAADTTRKVPQSKRVFLVGLQCNAEDTAKTESWCYSLFQNACGNINAIKKVNLFLNFSGSFCGYCLEIIYQKDCGTVILNAINSLKESIDPRASIFSECKIINDNSWKIEITKSHSQQSFECDRIVQSMYSILQNKKDRTNKKINIKTMHSSVTRFYLKIICDFKTGKNQGEINQILFTAINQGKAPKSIKL